MRDHLTMREMEFEFYGPRPVIEAEFYDHQAIDVDASKEAGKSVYKPRPYIHLFCKQEGVDYRRPVRAMDHKQFPEAWATYQKEKEDERHREIQDSEPTRSNGGIGQAFAERAATA